MNNIIFDITDDNGSMEAGEYITLSSKDYSIIEAANISFRLAGGREYYFTSLLHQTIAREII
jgi:hypothetical protein